MRRLLASVTAAAFAAFGVPTQASPAWATTPSQTLEINGHGWGHGYGMGAYGALGYALADWNYTQILGHYYGGTVLAPAPTPAAVMSVHLQELDGAASVTVTASGGGQLILNGQAQGRPTMTVARSSLDEVVSNSNGGDLAVTGPWSTGSSRLFAGSIIVKASLPQIWNRLPLDQYVEGVVPRESPPLWPQAELQAQAVAARSFAVAYSARATVCDTTQCQVYGGDPGQYPNSYSNLSNAAVTSTAGQVLLCGSDAACGSPSTVALALYSSSSGGYTRGGPFPAVVDAGDATPTNPNHDWTVGVPASTVQAAFPAVGTLTGVTVAARNGLGDLGGRAESVVVSGTRGSQSVTGDQFAAALHLKSDWFAIQGGLIPTVTNGGYWIADSAGVVHDYGDASSFPPPVGGTSSPPTVGIAATTDARGYWLVASDGGIAAFGDAGGYGSMRGNHLNAPMLGVSADVGTKGYWTVAGDGGIFSFGGARFYGSTGNMKLNQPVVAMASTSTGGGYWLVASDGGVFTFGDARFYGSTGNMRLNQPVVGMIPAQDGRGYWLVARDGGIFTFGDASFVGSLPGLGIADKIVAASATPDGRGYLMLSSSGRVYAFGDATYLGEPFTLGTTWSGRAVGITVVH